MSGGVARYNAVEHPYYLKEVSMNPYIGTVHDGISTGFGQGFSAKHIPFLYRFRHNIIPQGMGAGFFARNIAGKHVHWLEVSTIEKLRIRIVGDEAFPPMVVTAIVIAFTTYHLFRYVAYHPDLTMFNLAVFTSKPWVIQIRHAHKHPLDKKVFKFVQRVPSEFYNMDDPIYSIYKNGYAANDPWLEFVKGIGKEDELQVHASDRGWGEGSRGRLLPRSDVPYKEQGGHAPLPIK